MNFDYIKEHASGIFFGTGCACMIATVTSAILNTKSNQLKIDEIKKDAGLDDIHKKKEIIKTTIKSYIPTAIGVVGTLYSFAEVYLLSKKKILSLATAYALSTETLNAHRDAIRQVLSKEDANKVEMFANAQMQQQTKYSTTPMQSSDIYETGTGTYLCLDTFTGRLFRSNKDVIERARAELNNRFHVDMFIEHNDFCDIINLPRTTAGSIFGWDVSKRNSIEFRCYDYGPHPNTGEPLLIVDFGEAGQDMDIQNTYLNR